MSTEPEGDSPDFVGIPRQFISPDAVTGVHLYVFVGGRYVLYRSGNDPVDAESLAKLQRRNIETLYVTTEQRAQLEAYIVDHLRDVIAEAGSSAQQGRIVRDAMRAVLRNTLTKIDSPRDFQRLRGVSDALAEKIVANRALLSAVVRFADGDDRIYTHSANVAAYAMVLASRHPQLSSADVSSIGLGAMIHDIGLARIEPNLLAKPHDQRSDLERYFVGRHPSRGASALEQIGIEDQTVLDIVRFHHAHGDMQLSVPVQIVQLADVFDTLTSVPRRNAPNGPFAALYDMRHRMNDRFSPELIREFVLTLGAMTDIEPDSPVAPLSRRRQSEGAAFAA